MNKIEMVDPKLILANDNVRFGLIPSRLDKMMNSIVELGGVQTAIKVSKLSKDAEAPNGEQYRLNTGHYRLAGVLKLNADKGAGLQIPVEVEPEVDAITRLRRQVSENFDRENFSPIDTALAMKRFLDAGLSRQDVRTIFSQPSGKKGALQPLSNAALNMYVSFLDFSQSIQEKIHEGFIGVGGAYELSKVPKDRQKEVLASIESDRLSQIEKEEKDEDKFLASEAKATELTEKQAKLKAEIESAAELKAKALQAADEKAAAASEAYKVEQATKEAEAKKAATAHRKALEADAKAEAKKAQLAGEKHKKLTDKQAETEKKATAKKTAATAKKVAAKKESAASKPIGKGDVQKATAVKTTNVKPTSGKMKFDDITDFLDKIVKNAAKEAPLLSTFAMHTVAACRGMKTPIMAFKDMLKAAKETA